MLSNITPIVFKSLQGKPTHIFAPYFLCCEIHPHGLQGRKFWNAISSAQRRGWKINEDQVSVLSCQNLSDHEGADTWVEWWTTYLGCLQSSLTRICSRRHMRKTWMCGPALFSFLPSSGSEIGVKRFSCSLSYCYIRGHGPAPPSLGKS